MVKCNGSYVFQKTSKLLLCMNKYSATYLANGMNEKKYYAVNHWIMKIHEKGSVKDSFSSKE